MAAAERDTVLVVEDDPAVRDLLVSLLRDEGYHVEQAHHGADALRLLEQHRASPGPLCLVLLDMMMPQLDGLALLQRLADQNSYVPIVAMSASTEHLRAAAAAGAHATLSKPFDIERLLAVVARNCAAKARSKEP
ncbi:MAG: response regulator [Chloroflexi bacterium]|nr:response regulator [Chloroflexota bacterium]